MYATIAKFYPENATPVSSLNVRENYSQTNTADPNVWGPHFWKSLHMSAAHYPTNPAPIVKERIKHRILAIPYEIPCAKCQNHANNYIQSVNLDEVVSTRKNLVHFYVDFHNKVNARTNKKIWTYEDAYKEYGI